MSNCYWRSSGSNLNKEDQMLFKLAILAWSLMKKCIKFQFWGILDKCKLVCQSSLNLAEIYTMSSLDQDNKSDIDFLKILTTFYLIVLFAKKW